MESHSLCFTLIKNTIIPQQVMRYHHAQCRNGMHGQERSLASSYPMICFMSS